jgi:L-ascorbate metabolism protein UlaG (beta-lactamase superfamily)
MRTTIRAVSLILAIAVICGTAHAQNVKVTPIGQKTGEFCSQDRAILFEDPTGVKILYDPANTVAAGSDRRLGEVHVILISHAHGVHLGNARLAQDPDSDGASCAGGAGVTTPAANSNTAEIAAAKQSAVFAGGGLASIISRLIAAATGSNTAGCPTSGLTNETVVPRNVPCTAGLGLGSKRTVRMMTATRGVQISAVTAEHPNDLSPAFIAEPERTDLQTAGLGAYVGVANGFVLTFTNGLTVYLSGDTGLTSDMSTVVHDYYGATLAVINMGDVFTTGPEEAAFAVTNLIRAVSVIPSHVNEEATRDGQPFGARTSRFVELLSRGSKGHSLESLLLGLGRVSVHLPLSGVTMQFNRFGRCELGCQGK